MSKRELLIVGSTNQVKVEAVKAIITTHEVKAVAVPSLVSAQPMGDQETLNGAINRAKAAREYGTIGIGLEGGVAYVDQGLLLINYGALVDEDNRIYIAGGARIYLPNEISKEIDEHRELGDIMEDYTKRTGIREQEGAIGIFTKNHVKRQALFEHIVKLLYGQWQAKNPVEQEVIT